MPRADSSPFVCAECGRNFRRKSDLRQHVLTHDADATRFHCSYPGCDHSSLQKSNLKTHYISRHLNQRPHGCNFDGCFKTYGDASALIRHEKTCHGYFRKEHKPYERPSSKKKRDAKSEVDACPFVKRGSEYEFSTFTPSLCESYSTTSSPASSYFPSTPSPSTAQSPSPDLHESVPAPQSMDSFLHEMVPDLFPNPNPEWRTAPGIAFDQYFGYSIPESLPTLPDSDLRMPCSADFAPLYLPPQSMGFMTWARPCSTYRI